jgi:hypothetical protein
MKINDIFANVASRKIVEHPFHLYVRDDKPVTLQGWIFSELVVAGVGEALQSTGLTWIWESTRTGPPIADSDENSTPEHRDRQVLAPGSVATLQEDLLEKNIHGFRRFVALYGGDAAVVTLTEDDDLRAEVDAFAAGKKSVIKCLVVQFGDVAADVIYFVPNERSVVDPLFHNFGIPPLEAVFSLRYKEMQGEDLETVIKYLSCAEHEH